MPPADAWLMKSLPLVGLAILAVGLVILLMAGSTGSVLGLDADRFANLVYVSALLVVFGSAFLWRTQVSGLVRGLGLWFLIILALVIGYQYRYELQDVASRLTAGLVPGSPLNVTDAQGRKSVILEKLPNGHFEARVLVNDAALTLMVDTGATRTILTHADAVAAGIEVDRLSYTVSVSTANGTALTAATRVGAIAIGDIVRRDVSVLVANDGGLGQSLLGMNVISTLSGFEISGDRLVLRD